MNTIVKINRKIGYQTSDKSHQLGKWLKVHVDFSNLFLNKICIFLKNK